MGQTRQENLPEEPSRETSAPASSADIVGIASPSPAGISHPEPSAFPEASDIRIPRMRLPCEDRQS